MGVYLIADTHLDDPCILNKSPRKFDDISEMNDVIIQKWHETISDGDGVLFGGDLAHSGISTEGFYSWVHKLGNIECILRGNHDPYDRSELDGAHLPIIEFYEFSYRGIDFFCCHKHSGVPKDFDGWTIHGHNHHKRPFVDVDNKRVNISVDVLGYEPVSIDEIADHIKRGESLEERSII